MDIRFWGVRGSIASPGPETANVGGNTSCVEVRCGEQRIVLDAGTGLRSLGNALAREQGSLSLTLLLSHFHWDHIQGLPFFVPAYMPQTKLAIVGSSDGRHSLRDKLSRQMTEPHFPVQLDDLAAALTYPRGASGSALRHRRRPRTCRATQSPRRRVRVSPRARWAVARVRHRHRALRMRRPDASRARGGRGRARLRRAIHARGVSRSKVGWGHSTYVAGERGREERRRSQARPLPPRPATNRRRRRGH